MQSKTPESKTPDLARRRFLFRRDVPAASGGNPPAASDAARRVAIVDARCLARHGVECRLCADACGERAIRFVPAPGGIARMTLDAASCTGCGECVGPCPVQAIALA